MPKVAVVGAGMVGSCAASEIAREGWADVALLDADGDLARGKALDISHSLFLSGSSSKVEGGDSYRLAEGAAAAVITAGFPRKPGMSREDLLKRNAEVVSEVTERLLEVTGPIPLVVVTNPLDLMTYLAWRVSGLPRSMVMGMAGMLDGARYAYHVSRELGVPISEIRPVVIGTHGEEMLPLPRFTTVGGRSLADLLSPDRLDELADRTREAGAEVVRFLRSGSAHFAPGACAARMARCLVTGERLEVPCSVRLEGEYGLRDVFLGVPVVLSAGGWERVVELPLEGDEVSRLREAAEAMRSRMEELDAWLEGSLP
ncbi:MAG: malate dehydrogenase [Candidatus Geothermincolales bacterium]